MKNIFTILFALSISSLFSQQINGDQNFNSLKKFLSKEFGDKTNGDIFHYSLVREFDSNTIKSLISLDSTHATNKFYLINLDFQTDSLIIKSVQLIVEYTKSNNVSDLYLYENDYYGLFSIFTYKQINPDLKSIFNQIAQGCKWKNYSFNYQTRKLILKDSILSKHKDVEFNISITAKDNLQYDHTKLYSFNDFKNKNEKPEIILKIYSDDYDDGTVTIENKHFQKTKDHYFIFNLTNNVFEKEGVENKFTSIILDKF